MHHAPATCVAVAATTAAAATTVTTTAAAAAAAAATAEADSSAVPERERIQTGCCRCFSCGGSTALLGQLEQLFDCCCHARAGTSSCFASCRITKKNMTFTGVGKQESVGSHLVVKNAKISSKIHISLSICSHRWRRRTTSDQRLRT